MEIVGGRIGEGLLEQIFAKGLDGIKIGGLQILVKKMFIDPVDNTLRVGIDVSVCTPESKVMAFVGYAELGVAESLTLHDFGNVFNVTINAK